MAAHRRLLVSARRHTDRRFLAKRRAAEGPLAARPGRRALSRALSFRRTEHRQDARCGKAEQPDPDGKKADGKDGKEKEKLVEDATKTILEKDNQLRMGLQMVRGLPKIMEVHAQ